MARAFFLYLGSLAVINDEGLFGNESPVKQDSPRLPLILFCMTQKCGNVVEHIHTLSLLLCSYSLRSYTMLLHRLSRFILASFRGSEEVKWLICPRRLSWLYHTTLPASVNRASCKLREQTMMQLKLRLAICRAEALS